MPYTKEQESYFRVGMLVNVVALKCVREAVHHYSTIHNKLLNKILPSFNDFLREDKVRKILTKLRKTHLTHKQWYILYPPSGHPVSVVDLDLTLCLLLLRSIYGLIPPANTWDRPPLEEDDSAEGGFAQLKAIRNILSHPTTSGFTTADFQKHFDNVKDAILNIQKTLTISSISEGDILQYKTECIDKEMADELSDVVKEWAQQNTDLNEEITKVRNQLDDVSEGMNTLIQAQMKSKPQDSNQDPEEKKFIEGIRSKLRTCLKRRYKSVCCHLCINPTDLQDTMHMDSIFVDQELILEDPSTAGRGAPMPNYFEAFTEIGKDNPVERILALGKAGVGKTSLGKRIGFEWTDTCDRETKVAKKFEIVFFLMLKDIKKGQSLVSAIKEQLLDEEDVSIGDLEKYIAKKYDKILIILDGLDEMEVKTSGEIDKIVDRERFKNVCVLITARPWGALWLTKSGQKIDRHVRILGFTEKSMKEFISKFFENICDKPASEAMSQKLIEEIAKSKIKEIAQNPLLLNMLCILFSEHDTLPTSITDIYKQIIEWLFERYLEKEKIGNSEELRVKYTKTLFKLGELGLEIHSQTPQLFTEQAIIDRVGDLAFKVGLISNEKVKGKCKGNTQFSFLHNSFREYTIAYYVARELENNQNTKPWDLLTKQIQTVEMLLDRYTLLLFCAGESSQLAERVLDFLEQVLVEIDLNVKQLKDIIAKLTKDAELSYSEFKALKSSFFISSDAAEILDLQAVCLINMKGPKVCSLHQFYSFVSERFNVKQAFDLGVLKPIECIVNVRNDDDLEKFSSEKASVICLTFKDRYNLTDRSISVLKTICENNKHSISVLVEAVTAEVETLVLLISLLKDHCKVKYKYLGLQGNKYGETGWVSVFKSLSGIRQIVGLDLAMNELHPNILKRLGQIVSLNSKSLFSMNLMQNKGIRGSWKLLTDSIEAKGPLVLTELYLLACLRPEDKEALDGMLVQCPNMEIFDIRKCEVDVSRSVLSLAKLIELKVSETVNNKNTGLDMKKILSNLHTLTKLETFYAWNCGIDDASIQLIQFDQLKRLKHISLMYGNDVSEGVTKEIKVKCDGLGIEIKLD